MISGQTLYTEPVEENFFTGQNSIETVQNLEIANAPAETTAMEFDANPNRFDLSAKFARLKKSMRKRSVSIF